MLKIGDSDMGKLKGQVDESILVCIYYGPNGERLIRRGHKLAKVLDCPLYVLTVDPLPYDEFDADKSGYVEHWEQLSEELGAEEFIMRDNEKQPITRAIAEVADTFHVTQVVIGQTPQNRWEEITKGSFVNALQRELSPFTDIYIVSIDRAIKNKAGQMYERGVRAFLLKKEDGYELYFSRSRHNQYEGIFYKDLGTDFNNGMFKFVCEGKTFEVHVTNNHVTEEIVEPPNL